MAMGSAGSAPAVARWLHDGIRVVQTHGNDADILANI